MPKERSVNPAQAQRKADKQKEIAKSKKNLQNQRNEKLARRNPERVQRQIDDLKELDSRGGLRPKDKETLAQLERDVRGIQRAREALGDAAPKFPSREKRRDYGGGDTRQEQRERRQNLGKRRRDEGDVQSSDTDPEVRDIPMPRDTPPPTPHKREQLPSSRKGPDGQRMPHGLPEKPKPPEPAQTVYSSAPQLRDLKKEAVQFVPSVVAQQKKRAKGEGRLLEPEEIEKLEKAGYFAAKKAAQEAGMEAGTNQVRSEVEAGGDQYDMDLNEEMMRLEQEMKDVQPKAEETPSRRVQVEEVEDAGD